MKKLSVIIFLLATGVHFSGCRISDIRTPEMKSAIDAPGSGGKVRTMLQTTVLAHGAEKWENFKTVSFDLRDEFRSLKFVSPYRGPIANVRLDYVPDSYDGRLTILDGKNKDEQWGLSDFHSWVKKPGGEMVWKHHKNAKFWIPTYQYFIQLPLKILEADYLRYGGQRTVSGVKYDIFFASWRTDDPQKDRDQYALYVNPKNNLVDMVEFTVRSAGKWIHAACLYEGYQEKEGVMIPASMTILGPKVDFDNHKVFHRMEILNTTFNAVDQKELTMRAPE